VAHGASVHWSFRYLVSESATREFVRDRCEKAMEAAPTPTCPFPSCPSTRRSCSSATERSLRIAFRPGLAHARPTTQCSAARRTVGIRCRSCIGASPSNAGPWRCDREQDGTWRTAYNIPAHRAWHAARNASRGHKSAVAGCDRGSAGPKSLRGEARRGASALVHTRALVAKHACTAPRRTL
jgi:hypothetical protein